MQHLIQDAKQALPMPDLWRKLGWPGEPSRSCRRPYAPEDTRNKGSVFQTQSGAWLFHDFVSGENFDEVSLLARVEGLSNGDACRRFIEVAGQQRRLVHVPNPSSHGETWKSAPVSPRPPSRPHIGRLDPFCDSDVETLARLRGLDPAAIKLAASESLLFKAVHRNHPSWVVTDGGRWNARFRRMDGLPYELSDGLGGDVSLVKSLAPSNKRGSRCWSGWPIGLQHILEGGFDYLLLTEGEPDLLAGFQVILESGLAGIATPLCLASSSPWIGEELLIFFRGKRVRIFPHLDNNGAGSKAAEKWRTQLARAGAVVDAFDLKDLLRADGRRVKDLNDVCLMDRGERESLDLMGGMFS